MFQRLAAEGRASIGRKSYGIPTIREFEGDRTTSIHIGAFTSIGPAVEVLLGGEHPTDRVSTFPLRMKYSLRGAGLDGFPMSRGDVVIGNDVWIGFGTTILSGVTIGDGAIIGANSLVVGDIAPYAIAAGSPARVLKYRCSPQAIERMRRIAWWEWDDRNVVDSVELISDLPIEDAIDRLEVISISLREGSKST